MKINIPPIVRDLPLKDYAPEMNGGVVKVWVNPTRDFTRRMIDIKPPTDAKESDWKDGIPPQNAEWFAELFSQDADPATHWTDAELQEVFQTDPALWGWLQAQAWNLIGEHIAGLEKKPARP